jgi:MFS family permease
MTQPEGADASAAVTTRATVVEPSPWAPLAHRAFRWLWLGVLIGYLGFWMQTVGAQWLLVSTPNAGAMVALVQTAATLPVMLLALPAGVLADAFDRRWLLLTVQVYVFVVAGTLAALTAAGLITPTLTLVFTFLLGLGGAVQLPTWQAVIPELVPRSELGAATRLEMVGVNFGRAAGPALAGLLIAGVGVPAVFGVNAVSGIFFAAALLLWRRPPSERPMRRERFVPALRAGGRYVWNEPVVRRILLRAVLFLAPGTALWALLPLVARRRLGLDAGGYGALFGALGAGAILTALVAGRIRARLSTNRLLALAGVVYAAVLAVIVAVPNFALALVVLVFAGFAWTAVISTLNAEMQMLLPAWVRARGLAIYLMTFTGCLALASVVWGQVTEAVGVETTFLIAAALVAAGVVVGAFRPVPETGHLDQAPASYWGEPRMAFEPELDTGPIMVTVIYTVAPERQADYLVAMDALRRSRRRSGATRWELYRDAERPNCFVEAFRVASWEEHLRQHEGRLTAADQAVEERALAFSDPPVTAAHWLPPTP